MRFVGLAIGPEGAAFVAMNESLEMLESGTRPWSDHLAEPFEAGSVSDGRAVGEVLRDASWVGLRVCWPSRKARAAMMARCRQVAAAGGAVAMTHEAGCELRTPPWLVSVGPPQTRESAHRALGMLGAVAVDFADFERGARREKPCFRVLLIEALLAAAVLVVEFRKQRPRSAGAPTEKAGTAHDPSSLN
jgi:hypothetical protein